MKSLPIRRDEAAFTTIGILRQVMSLSPNATINVDQIRKRCRVLDLLDTVKNEDTELRMEDDDHDTVKQAIKEFPFNLAHRALLRVIDDVLEAKDAK